MKAGFLMLSGRFFRSIVAERRHLALAKPRAVDCGRYHAPGQAALYMSPEAAWARWVAASNGERDGLARVMFPIVVSRARVLDLRDDAACRRLGIDRGQADLSWRRALETGGTPPSWRVADAARRAGADGLIDRSRLFPSAWHVTLFGWNEPGQPQVSLDGDPEPLA